MSGYTPCACRDCMDVTVSSDASKPELCEECREADCAAHEGPEPTIHHPGVECQREDAYDDAPECEGHYDSDDALTWGLAIGEPVFCDGSCMRGR